jgi:RNA polymerase sigma-70 factor (ECF subfamily)
MPLLVFPETPRNLVLKVAEGCRALRAEHPVREDWRDELGQLCAHYREVIVVWFQSRGIQNNDAQDLAGDFIHRWLSGSPLFNYVPGDVPFRRFLSRCLGNFLLEHIERQQSAKRGGSHPDGGDFIDEYPESPSPWLPEDDVALARAVYARSVQRVRERFQDDERWLNLVGVALGTVPFVSGDSYLHLADKTGLTPGAVKVRVHRLRQAFWECFESEVLKMCGPGVPANEEVAALSEALLQAMHQSP